MARQAQKTANKSGPREVGLFLDMLAAERGAGANTLDAYARDLDDLAGWLSTRKRAVKDAGTDDLRAYLAALAS
ncbi:MAG: site-specific integrase, partial [Pseudolabrys sp.]